MKGGLALVFWTGLGLLLSIQSYLLWPNVTFSAAMQTTMPRWYLWGFLAPFIFAADHRVLARMASMRRILAHVPLGISVTFVAMALEYAVQRIFKVGWGPE